MPGREDPQDYTGVFYPGGRGSGSSRSSSRPSPGPRGRLPEGRITLEGTVRSVSTRSEQERVQYPDGHWGETAVTVVIFRLEQYDSSGNRILSVPVEMRGASFTGQLQDGDRVSVAGSVSSGVLHSTVAVDVESGARFAVRVDAKKSRSGLLTALGVVAGFTVLAVFAAFAFGIFAGFNRVVDWVTDPDSSRPPGVPAPPFPRVPGNDAPTALVMPDVVGETNVTAMQLMSRAGFTFTNVVMDPVEAPDAQFGRIVRTNPAAGAKVSSDAVVRLYIGK